MDQSSDRPDDRVDTTPNIFRAMREMVELLLEPLREQLTIANQRADRAERRIDELQTVLDAKTRELTTLQANQVQMAPARRRWWQWGRRR